MIFKHEVHGEVNILDDDQVAVFYNNATIMWGMDALKHGMTKTEALEALHERLFDVILADAFIKKMVVMCNISWIDGKLYLPEGAQ